jgi:hypothetical protein
MRHTRCRPDAAATATTNLSTASRLTSEQIDRLERLPGWTWDAQEDGWNQALAALAQYATRTGSAEPPKTQCEDGIRIGWWIGTQRQAYRKGELFTRAHRQARSHTRLGMESPRCGRENGFSHLGLYLQQTGTARVPVAHTTETGFPLGQCTAVQRRRHALGKLTAQRARRLESLSGWSWHSR